MVFCSVLLLLLNTVIDVPVALVVQIPCIWQSLVPCSVFACGVPDYGFSCEFASGNIYIFSTLWFDSGYMSASVYEAPGRFSHVVIREGGRSSCSRVQTWRRQLSSRSCSSSNFGQLLHARCVVNVLAPFIDG